MNNVFKNVKCLMLIMSCGLMSVYTVKASHQPGSDAFWSAPAAAPLVKNEIKTMIDKRIEFIKLMSKENGFFLSNMVRLSYGVRDDLLEDQIFVKLKMAMLNHQYIVNLLRQLQFPNSRDYSERQFPKAVLDEILKILKDNKYFEIFHERVKDLYISSLRSVSINAMKEILNQIEKLKIEAYTINAIFTNKIDDEWKGNKAFPLQLVVWLMNEIFGQKIVDKLVFNQDFNILRKKATSLGKRGQESQVTYDDFEDLLTFFMAALYKQSSLRFDTKFTLDDAKRLLQQHHST